ncbi:MAG: hypothetical protein GC203_20460 [Phenylobacterium sp.]|nr:hypothetical protein [Phenylobacterium sp.]
MASDIHLRVSPAGGGWSLGCDQRFQPIYFLSELLAQRAAAALAAQLTTAGHDVLVAVADRSALVIATRRYFADG